MAFIKRFNSAAPKSCSNLEKIVASNLYVQSNQINGDEKFPLVTLPR